MSFSLSVRLLQASVSAYSLYAACISIKNTKPYEEATEKVAQYSNIAEEQLEKTRSTLAAGAVASFVSLMTALIPVLVGASLSVSSDFLTSLVATVVVYGVRVHVRDFWKGKAKVPLVDQYNKAITASNTMERMLGISCVGWIAMTGLAASRFIF